MKGKKKKLVWHFKCPMAAALCLCINTISFCFSDLAICVSVISLDPVGKVSTCCFYHINAVNV